MWTVCTISFLRMSLGIGTVHSGSLKTSYGIRHQTRQTQTSKPGPLSMSTEHTRYRWRLVLKHVQLVNNSSSRLKTLELVRSVGKPAVSCCYAVATGNEGNLIGVARFMSRRWCSKEKPISRLARQLCWHTTESGYNLK
jgi:hypothetical protein